MNAEALANRCTRCNHTFLECSGEAQCDRNIARAAQAEARKALPSVVEVACTDGVTTIYVRSAAWFAPSVPPAMIYYTKVRSEAKKFSDPTLAATFVEHLRRADVQATVAQA